MKRRLICALAAALIFAAALTYHTLILRELPEGQVEVLALDLPAAEQALAPAAAEWGWEPVQEGERLVIRSQSPFAAPAMRAALSGASVDSQVIDYAWVADVAAQSGRLWRVWGVVWGIWLLWGLLRALVRTEWGRFQAARKCQYPAQYLSDAGVRLMAEAIVLAVEAIAAILALQWLWRLEFIMPTGLLPDGSLFHLAHYHQWTQSTFPDGLCSSYGASLIGKLRLGHALTAVECGALTAGAVAIRSAIKK